MIIKLYDWEIKEAIADYVKKEYGMSFNTNHIDCSEFEYEETEKVYKKHKNGKIVKNEYGHPEVDWENSLRVTKIADFHEGSSVSLYLYSLGESNNE
jgi:hypothetical protein